jgi:glycosyltransferase involved in cell wall biosynthesis
VSKPRLDLVLDSLERGGAETVLLQLSTRFALLGCAVRIITIRSGGDLVSGLPKDVGLVSLGARRARHAVISLSRKFCEDPPSAILATQAHANASAVIAWLLSGISARLVLRETTTPVQQVGLSRAVAPMGVCRMVYKFANAVVAPSDGVATRLSELIPADRVSVIPNPVDVDRIKHASRALLPYSLTLPPRFIVGMGTLRAVKRFDRLIAAYSLIAAKADLDLVIVGDGSDRCSLVALADKFGVKGRVHFLGSLANPFPVLARAEVFVLSSDREGLPNALLEALALDVRTVAVDCPSGPTEILEGGKWGALVPLGDTPGLAKAILASIERAPISTCAMVRSRYGPNQICARYLEILGIEAKLNHPEDTTVERQR